MECTLRLVLTLVVSSLLGLAAHSHLAHRAPGSLAEGMCEVVHLAREGTLTTRDTATRVHSVARQTARCACRRGQIAGTSRGRPACVNAQVVHSREWCSMRPCLEGEQCGLLHNRSGWTCSVYGERIKTTTVS